MGEGDSINWNMSKSGHSIICTKCQIPVNSPEELLHHIEHYHKDVWAEHLKILKQQEEKEK